MRAPVSIKMSLQKSPRLSLVLGGARSGKSRHAEGLLAKLPAPWVYIATAQAYDEEMRARIGEHQRRRDARWSTIEAPLDLADAIETQATSDAPMLIDCLTLWLSNVMLAGRDVAAEQTRLIAALAAGKSAIVAVSNEVGLGIVPDNPLARDFRDAQGRLNQRVAELADHVVFMAAGLPLTLK
jgi:adenosylcobinamide kinase / adenosylcobinamide-phosphate guanylyltransferase